MFDGYNLISALHSYMSTKDNNFKNLLPPLHLLPKDQEHELKTLLKNLNFDIEIPRAA